LRNFKVTYFLILFPLLSFGDTLYTTDFSNYSGWGTLGNSSIFNTSTNVLKGVGSGGNGFFYFFNQPDTFSDFDYSCDVTFTDAANDTDMAGIGFRLSGVFSGYYFSVSPSHRYVIEKVIYTSPTENTFSLLKDAYHSHILKDINRLRVIAIGSNLYFLVNGILIFQSSDTQFSNGNIGVTVKNSRNADFDNIIVLDPPSILPTFPNLFSDNFNDGDLKLWMRPRIIPSGETFTNSGTALSAQGGSSPSLFNYITTGQYDNFNLSIKATLVSDPSPDTSLVFYGIFFRGNDVGMGYYFGINKKQLFWLTKRVNRSPFFEDLNNPLTSKNFIIAETTNTLAVRAIGDSIYLSVNGTSLLAVTDKEYGAGDVGIFLGQDLKVEFADFVLTPLSTSVAVVQHQPLEKLKITTFPNPFSGTLQIRAFGSKEMDLITFKIFSLAGELVNQGNFFPGPNGFSAYWLGKDLAGRKTAPGVYLFRAKWGGKGKRAMLIHKN